MLKEHKETMGIIHGLQGSVSSMSPLTLDVRHTACWQTPPENEHLLHLRKTLEVNGNIPMARMLLRGERLGNGSTTRAKCWHLQWLGWVGYGKGLEPEFDSRLAPIFQLVRVHLG